MRHNLPKQEKLLNLRDPQGIESRKPLLIAHRGGVVSPDTPENSLAAIRLASQRGYDMVELDIMEAKDQVPMLFHSFGASGHLYVDCGIDQYLEELTSDELSRITYRLSTQPIASLAEALGLCSKLGMGVMLDIKATTPSNEFLTSISESLKMNGLVSCAVVLSTSPSVAECLKGLVIFPLREEEYHQLLIGEATNLRERFYFEWGSRIKNETVRLVQEMGIFVIAAINFFHYPRHARQVLAAQDIQRLLNAGVDGFQIDDEFREFLQHKP